MPAKTKIIIVSAIIVLVSVFVLLLWLAVVEHRVKTPIGNGKNTDQVFCTQEAKLCPDGSYVSRTGPNCEFAACPETSKEPLVTPDFTLSGIEEWQTYRNEEYGFEITLTRAWEGYKTVTKTALGESNGKYIHFQVPTSSKNYGDGNGYATVFAISIYPTPEWERAQQGQWPKPRGYITKNNVYAFSYSTWQDAPEDLISANTDFEIAKIISTFKLINSKETTNWQTYRNEEYGLEVRYLPGRLPYGRQEIIFEKSKWDDTIVSKIYSSSKDSTGGSYVLLTIHNISKEELKKKIDEEQEELFAREYPELILQFEETTFQGRPAYRANQTGFSSGYEIDRSYFDKILVGLPNGKTLEIHAAFSTGYIDGNGHFISFGGMSFDDQIEEYNQILSTFKFIN